MNSIWHWIVFTSVDKLWKHSVTDKLFQSQLFSHFNLVMFLSVQLFQLFQIWILNHFKCWMSELRCIKFVFTFIVSFACNWKPRRQGFKFSKFKSYEKTVYVEMFCSGSVDKYNICFKYFNQILGWKSWHNLVQSYDL